MINSSLIFKLLSHFNHKIIIIKVFFSTETMRAPRKVQLTQLFHKIGVVVSERPKISLTSCQLQEKFC